MNTQKYTNYFLIILKSLLEKISFNNNSYKNKLSKTSIKTDHQLFTLKKILFNI